MKDFAGKVAFITGGASGAGLGQAELFGLAGMKVVIADVRQDHLDSAMEYLKSKNIESHAIRLDVTDRAGFAAAADEVEKVYGTPPQLLILTAGVNTFGPAECSTYEDFDLSLIHILLQGAYAPAEASHLRRAMPLTSPGNFPNPTPRVTRFLSL